MRIAMIGSRGLPAGVGGVEQVVETLARGLTQRGHDVLVYSRRHYVGQNTTDAAKVIFTPGLPGNTLDTITHSATASLDALFRHVDLVHVHSPGPALWSWLPAMRHPVVFTVHAPDWQREKWSRLGRAVLRKGLRTGSRCARAITAVSPSLAADLQAQLRKPVTCIPNAAPAVTPQPTEVAQALGLIPGQYALHVGRMTPEKRLAVLLDAWKRANLDWPLVVVASDDVAGYAQQCRACASANVRFVGPKVGRELAGLFAHAGMVIQPSVLEGASLVVLEAAAYGKCCLLTDIPANRDILGDTAVYLPQDDSSVLAEQIVRYRNEEALRVSLGESARRHVQEHFDADGVVSRYIMLYETITSVG